MSSPRWEYQVSEYRIPIKKDQTADQALTETLNLNALADWEVFQVDWILEGGTEKRPALWCRIYLRRLK